MILENHVFIHIITENLFNVFPRYLVTQNYSSFVIKLFVGFRDTFGPGKPKDAFLKQATFYEQRWCLVLTAPSSLPPFYYFRNIFVLARNIHVMHSCF